jgi:hypothetical protein
MSKRTICSTAGLIIRNNLGKKIKTYAESCNVRVFDSNKVEINSGYVSPIDNKRFRYTAIGHVSDNTLIFEKIKVHRGDSVFIPMSDF